MSTTDPVFFLPEVTLTAHIIGMIQINFGSFTCHKKIPIILIVTGVAGKGVSFIPMNDLNICMGNFSCIMDLYFFIIVT